MADELAGLKEEVARLKKENKKLKKENNKFVELLMEIRMRFKTHFTSTTKPVATVTRQRDELKELLETAYGAISGWQWKSLKKKIRKLLTGLKETDNASSKN